MEFETGLNLFLTFVNIVAIRAVIFAIAKPVSAMKAHLEYM